MKGYEFFRGGTRLMAFFSFVLIVLFVYGIVSSAMGGHATSLNLAGIIISSATMDGSIALGVLCVWIGLLSAGIITRDRYIRGKGKG